MAELGQIKFTSLTNSKTTKVSRKHNTNCNGHGIAIYHYFFKQNVWCTKKTDSCLNIKPDGHYSSQMTEADRQLSPQRRNQKTSWNN